LTDGEITELQEMVKLVAFCLETQAYISRQRAINLNIFCNPIVSTLLRYNVSKLLYDL
jgi:hypothetical protein